MKKSYLILMLAFVACFFGAKADELTVANGTATSTDLPVKATYCDTQGTKGYMIYAKDSLVEMTDGKIEKLSFHIQAMPPENAGCVLQLSLKEIDETSFVNTSPDYSDFTECGTHTIVEGEETFTFDFDVPFTYSGDKNLLIKVEVITKSNDYKTYNTYGVSQVAGSNVAVTQYGSSSKYFINFLPKITFEYSTVPNEWDAKVNPASVNFGTVYMGQDSIINVTLKNRGVNAFTPSINALSAPFSTTYVPAELTTGQSVEIPVKFAPTADGVYKDSLMVNCGEAGSFKIYINGKSVELGSEVIVCDNSNQDGHVPVFGSYCDTEGTKVQFIYPKEKLGALNGRAITSVKFFATSAFGVKNCKLQLSVKEVDYTTFERETANSVPSNVVADMTVVGTLVTTGTGNELLFQFDQPFNYNGGNLAFETLVLEKGNYVSTSWYGETQTYDCAYYEYTSSWGGTSTALVKFLPKAFFESVAQSEPVEEHTYAVTGTPAALFGLEKENAWDPENAPEMQMNDNGLYEWTSAETELEANAVVKFKVVQDHAWDVSYPAENVEKTAEKHGKYTLNVTYNPETNEVVGTLTLVEEIVDLGKVYIIGNVNGNDWATNVGVEMDTEDGKIYTKTVQVRTGDVEGVPGLKADTEIDYGYFEFATKLMEGAEDWDQLAPYRFGAVSDGPFHVYKTMMNGQELSLTSDYGQSFEIEPGDYELTVDMENMTLKINGTTLTSIEELNINNAAKSGRFNLMGQPVDENYKGIVIENGVKKIQK